MYILGLGFTVSCLGSGVLHVYVNDCMIHILLCSSGSFGKASGLVGLHGLASEGSGSPQQLLSSHGSDLKGRKGGTATSAWGVQPPVQIAVIGCISGDLGLRFRCFGWQMAIAPHSRRLSDSQGWPHQSCRGIFWHQHFTV